jgi:hypothetical protein
MNTVAKITIENNTMGNWLNVFPSTKRVMLRTSFRNSFILELINFDMFTV